MYGKADYLRSLQFIIPAKMALRLYIRLQRRLLKILSLFCSIYPVGGVFPV